MNVPTVAAVEGGLNGTILTDMSQQLPQDRLSFRQGFGPIVEPEQLPGPLALSVQVGITTVVRFSSQHLLFFGS
jgi:hypothetical protein